MREIQGRILTVRKYRCETPGQPTDLCQQPDNFGGHGVSVAGRATLV